MPNRDNYESMAYHQKRAHNAWLSRASARGVTPTREASELVWELLLVYGDASGNLDLATDDIYKTAYELAASLVTQMHPENIYQVYRDDLVDAMADSAHIGTPEQCKILLRFANQVSTAFCEAYSDQLRRQLRHKRAEGLSNELKLAKRIQNHLLPKVIPDIDGFDFAGRLIPAEEIGGDYWSIKLKKDRDIVTLKLADITGHGVAAATLVAAVKFISGGFYQGSETASEVMKKTNRVLSLETPSDILVTMVYGWLRPSTYELTLVNAGHSPVFLCQKDLCIDVPLTGPVLGVNELSEYDEATFKLGKGDIIFFGSDGITEAGVHEQFGTGRLKKVVMAAKDRPADEIADEVVRAVTEFAPHPHDDISLLVIRVTGDPPEST